jgi:hypothetical protein
MYLTIWAMFIANIVIFSNKTPMQTLLAMLCINVLVCIIFWFFGLEFFSFVILIAILGALTVFFVITIITYFSDVLFGEHEFLEDNIDLDAQIVMIISAAQIRRGKKIAVVWLFASLFFRTIINVSFFSKSSFAWSNLYSNFSLPATQVRLFLNSFIDSDELLGVLIYHNHYAATLLAIGILLVTLVGISFVFTGGIKRTPDWRDGIGGICNTLRISILKHFFVLSRAVRAFVVAGFKCLWILGQRYFTIEDVYALIIVAVLLLTATGIDMYYAAYFARSALMRGNHIAIEVGID